MVLVGIGMNLANVSGDLSFTDLDIVASNGIGLSAIGLTPYTGSAGFQIAVGSGSTVSATNDAAINLAIVTASLPFADIDSTNSSTTGVTLDALLGSFSAGPGSTITNAGSNDFVVNGSNAIITYSGSINDTAGAGVSLTNNTGSTITFNGGLSISSGSNIAFNANGGGTVNVCDENPCNPAATGALVNTLTSTTGTALNVANTNIGANNLEFRSISAGTGASGPTRGIILNTTGTSGGLNVKGTGSAGSGGTIQRSSGPNVSLSATSNVSLSYMNIQDGGDDGINATNVTGFSSNGNAITNNGNSTTDEGIEFNNLFGVSTIINTTVTGNAHNNFKLDNSSGTLDSLTITGGSFSSTGNSGNHGFLFEARQNALVSAVTISGATFANNFSMGMQVITGDTATISSFIVTGSTFTDTGAGNTQEVAADFSTAQTSNLTYEFLNNTLTNHNSHRV